MRIPPSLLFGLGRFLLFILLEAVCIYMVCNNGIVQQYRLIGKLREVQGFFWEKYAAINEYSSLKETNNSLAESNALLMHSLYTLKEKSLPDTASVQDYPFSFTSAKVIRNTVNTTHNFLIIDKGSRHGITEDMGVITPKGVVGITRAVSENYSYVLSFLNTGQQVSAKIGTTNTFGPLKWNPEKPQTAILEEIPQHMEIKIKDTVFTSGFSAFYPPDIPIGTVEDYKLVHGVHLSLEIKLLQEFRNLRYVMVVKNNNREEIEQLVKSMQ